MVRLKMKFKEQKFNSFTSQLDLPFLGSDEELLDEIFKVLIDEFNLKPHSKQKFIDLGSGDGRVVLYVALNYGINSFGIEINKSLVQESKEKIQLLKRNEKVKRKFLRKISFIHGDFYNFDLEKYDFIYLYSLPTMQRFLKHIINSAKEQVIFIAYKYPLNELKDLLKLKKEITIQTDQTDISAYLYARK